MLDRVLTAAHAIGDNGLTRDAHRRFHAARMKTAWGRRSQRPFALVDGEDLLASAVRYDFAAVFDRRPIRVCGIGSLFTEPAHRGAGHARRLIETMRGRVASSDSVTNELSSLKEERDVIRARVGEMLEQLEALNL